VRKKTLNPHFDEEFVFRVKPGSCTIFFEVYNSNKLKDDDFLGQTEIPGNQYLQNHLTIDSSACKHTG
jgi:Ca2+-dependent lipid-binding protein